MVDGTYDVTVMTPLGDKAGEVTVVSRGDDVDIAVKAPIIGKQKATGKLYGDAFTAQGTIKALMIGTVDYTVEGLVESGTLTAEIRSSKGNFIITGTKR